MDLLKSIPDPETPGSIEAVLVQVQGKMDPLELQLHGGGMVKEIAATANEDLKSDAGLGSTTTEEMPWLLQLPFVSPDSWTGILKCLTKRDLQSLRVTCKTTEEWTTKFMNKERKNESGFHLTIVQSKDEFGRGLTFGEVVDKGCAFPIRTLNLINENQQVFLDPNIQEFLKLYGSGIKKLKLKSLSISSAVQRDFFARLENLTDLKILNIDAREFKGKTEEIENCIPPEIFGKIEVLKLDKIQDEWIWVNNDIGNWSMAFLERFPNLRVLRYPKLIYENSTDPYPLLVERMKFSRLNDYIAGQMRRNQIPKLEKIDLKNLDSYNKWPYCYFEGSDVSEAFLDFVLALSSRSECKNIRIYNVGAQALIHLDEIQWINFRRWLNEDQFFALVRHNDVVDGLNHHVYSMRNIAKLDESLDLPKLIKLDIDIPDRTIICDTIDDYMSTVLFDLSQLKTLRVNFHPPVKPLQPYENFILVSYFPEFELLQRFDWMNYLKLEFSSSFGEEKMTRDFFDVGALAFTRRFSSVSKLEVVNWNPSKKDFLILWSGMYFLEELILKDCTSLGDFGFIGQDEDHPVFLKLTRLKKLTLKVDKMKNLTDRTFKDVFRHMSLAEFILISEQPINQITRTGIEWLLQGPFAQSVLKFPFTTWSATTIPTEEMMPLKSKFKSLIF